MARIRTIKPEFWQNEELASLSEHARLLAIALLNHADDDGYFLANVALVRSACFPFEDDSSNVRRSIDELSSVGYIVVREALGKAIGRVVKFKDHQRIDRPQKSKLVEQFEQFLPQNAEQKLIADNSTNDRRTIDDQSLLERKGKEGNRERKVSLCDGFETWWTHYPKKVAKDAAEKAYARAVGKLGGDPVEAADRLLTESLPRFAELRKRELRYVPNPATWLNAGSWADEVAAVSPSQFVQAEPSKKITPMVPGRRKDIPAWAAR